MRSSKLATAAIAFSALAASASVNPTFSANLRTGLYAFHTNATGTCPGLDWHVTVESNGALVGFVGWDRMKHMAKLEGTVGKDGAFRMDAKEVGGANRTAVVSGTAEGDYLTTTIENSGTGCDKQALRVPRVVGGLGGGGG